MKNLLKILFISFLLQFVFSNEKIHRENTLLFSLHKEISPFKIDNEYTKTNNLDFNKFLIENDVIKIEPWLKSATEKDFDGDIYLNRIYRITINESSVKYLNDIIDFLQNLPIVQYVERENLHKTFYTPNDSQYNQQWFLSDINSNDAWDFWNDCCNWGSPSCFTI